MTYSIYDMYIFKVLCSSSYIR